MVSFGAVGQMLQGRFKRNQQSQFMPVRSDMRMLRVCKSTRSIVHRAHYITRKRQCTVMPCRTVGQCLLIIIPFCSIYSFHRHHVRIGALPASRNRSSMKVYHQMIFGCILQNVHKIIHRRYTVLAEEIYFYSFHSHGFKPGKFFLTHFRLVQTIQRTERTPRGGRIIP